MKPSRIGAIVLGVLAPLLLVRPAASQAQAAVSLTLEVTSHDGPVEAATIRLDSMTAITDARGRAVFRVRPGRHTLRAERLGYAAAQRTVEISARDTTITLELAEEAIEEEAIVVTSTRGERRIEDEPIRVEVVTQEEIEEKLLMTPGSIAMLLNETTGLRVQETSPSLGGAMIRIQGLRGRYTQMLSDGLPLYGGQAGSLGLLQIPPMDLRQVEVIKGAASALYGASALGGVVNLVSRRPDGVRELLVNRTTRDGTDALAWLAGEARDTGWSYTFLAGGHLQSRADVDGDAWTDIPRHRRASARPRLFWNGGPGRSAMITGGIMAEIRKGGGLLPTGQNWAQNLETQRLDVGGTIRLFLGDLVLDGRGAVARTAHNHRFGTVRERDAHNTLFAEIALRGSIARGVWTLGTALQRDAYRADDVSGFDYTYVIPSVFGQIESQWADWLALSLSARVDDHNEYGAFLSPRASALLRTAGAWTLRISAGTGYFAPTPFTEETEEVGLTRVLQLSGLDAERARSVSADLGGTIGPFEVNASVFGSFIKDALSVRATPAGLAELINLPGTTRTSGTELLVRYRRQPFGVTASHTFIRATEPALGATRRTVPNTPRHMAGVVLVYEVHGEGRAGLEAYYTGRQSLEDNPYRRTSRPYLIAGLLFERRFGPVRAFLNLENLGDVRQTRWQRVVLPEQGNYGRWTADSWAPLEGRVFNGGIRLSF
jgi:iron complex outermembrane receptor protein